MSKLKVTDAVHAEYGEPSFPPLVDDANDCYARFPFIFDIISFLNWLGGLFEVRSAGRVHGFVTSDEYVWRYAMRLRIGGGIIVVAFPRREDGDWDDESAADRSIAVYNRDNVPQKAVNEALRLIVKRFKFKLVELSVLHPLEILTPKASLRSSNLHPPSPFL